MIAPSFKLRVGRSFDTPTTTSRADFQITLPEGAKKWITSWLATAPCFGTVGPIDRLRAQSRVRRLAKINGASERFLGGELREAVRTCQP